MDSTPILAACSIVTAGGLLVAAASNARKSGKRIGVMTYASILLITFVVYALINVMLKAR